MTELCPVAVPAAADLVADTLRRAIHGGTWGPGEPLPSERELAAALGVSRVTLRGALRTLADHGYIVTRRGAHGGSTVSTDTSELRRALAQRVDEFEAILAFREIVECAAARAAAQRRDDAALGGLRATLDELRAATSVGSFRRADAAFHRCVAETAGNPLLRAAIEDARERLFTPTDALDFDVLLASSLDAHAAICAAIEARDDERAAAEMAAHLRVTRAEFLTALGLRADARGDDAR